MKKSNTRFAILGLLTEGPLTGYEIKKLIDARLSFFWSESYGQIYPELERLCGEKLVKAVKAARGNGKGARERRVYALTAKGRNDLFDWLLLPAEKESIRFELLLKLYLGVLIPRDELLGHLRTFRARYEKNLATLNRHERELRGVRDARENHPYILLTVLFGKRVYEAYLRWCDEALSFIEKHLKHG